MMFELFDPFGELSIREGALPHWFQPEATYFITFRTCDSVPAEISRLWHSRRDEWLKQHDVDGVPMH